MKKLETQSTVLLKHHLKALKLPAILAECEKVAARCAQENVDHLGFLLQLCELELRERERRAAARRLKAAGNERVAGPTWGPNERVSGTHPSRLRYGERFSRNRSPARRSRTW
jgi:hypothetical protein